jgi:hypothetical protein
MKLRFSEVYLFLQDNAGRICYYEPFTINFMILFDNSRKHYYCFKRADDNNDENKWFMFDDLQKKFPSNAVLVSSKDIPFFSEFGCDRVVFIAMKRYSPNIQMSKVLPFVGKITKDELLTSASEFEVKSLCGKLCQIFVGKQEKMFLDGFFEAFTRIGCSKILLKFMNLCFFPENESRFLPFICASMCNLIRPTSNSNEESFTYIGIGYRNIKRLFSNQWIDDILIMFGQATLLNALVQSELFSSNAVDFAGTDCNFVVLCEEKKYLLLGPSYYTFYVKPSKQSAPVNQLQGAIMNIVYRKNDIYKNYATVESAVCGLLNLLAYDSIIFVACINENHFINVEIKMLNQQRKISVIIWESIVAYKTEKNRKKFTELFATHLQSWFEEGLHMMVRRLRIYSCIIESHSHAIIIYYFEV